mmetsp:Transcript_112515/g.195263  ORF Transcript_112515/g.195263 Transcript_112515/m.195263 type:complete len:260 (-) Transcript_112515:3-782(-)
MIEMKLTAQKSAGFYCKVAADFLRGTDEKEPVAELRLLALGNAIPVAVSVASRIREDKLGTIVKVATDYPTLDGSNKRASGCAAVSVDICSQRWLAAKKAVFLDVDGVLHSLDGDDMLVPDHLRCLAAIVKRSSSMVVLSSSWRKHKKEWAWLNKELEKVGLEPITEATPVSETGGVDFQSRSDEILDWLARHPDVQHFVVLDDSDLSDPHGEAFCKHFVLVDARKALTNDDVTKALEILRLSINRSTLPAPALVEPAT